MPVVKNPLVNTGDARDVGSIHGPGRSPGVGKGYLLQYACLESFTDRGAWWATVHRVMNSQTWLNTCMRARTHTQAHRHRHRHTHTHTHLLAAWYLHLSFPLPGILLPAPPTPGLILSGLASKASQVSYLQCHPHCLVVPERRAGSIPFTQNWFGCWNWWSHTCTERIWKDLVLT